MEIKKTQKADLESRKPLFLEIGLCVSLLLMIGAFAWGADSKEIKIVDPIEEWIDTEQVEQTTQEPEIPQMASAANTQSIIAERLEIVDNERRIETNMVWNDFDEETQFSSGVTAGAVDGEVWPDFFEKVEFMPKFQGGDVQQFRRWVNGRVQYPDVAREMGIEGTVKVEFMVTAEGTVSDVTIVSDGGNSMRLLNNEVLRVVKSSPKWEPGRQGATPVKVKHKMDITFKVVR